MKNVAFVVTFVLVFGSISAITQNPNAASYNGPQYSHVVIVVDENHDYGQIIGNLTNAPYINGTLVSGGASFTDYESITHPSQPNYVAIYSGSTQGISDDGDHEAPDPTMDTVLQSAGKSFAGYVETGSPRKHTPWESFPEGKSVEIDFSQFPQTALGFANLPNVSWVVPNLEDDMHDGTILQGDTWLKTNLNNYAQWAVANNSLLILTFDEGTGSGTGVSSIIPTVFYGAGINPGSYGGAYNDYSTLNTIMSVFGLASSAPNKGLTAVPVNGTVFSTPAAFGPAGITTNGSAFVSGSLLQLTDDHRFKVGTAFLTLPVNISTFSTDFAFQLSQPVGDGFTFAIQNVGPQAMGGYGGMLGFGTIDMSVAIKFDPKRAKQLHKQ